MDGGMRHACYVGVRVDGDGFLGVILPDPSANSAISYAVDKVEAIDRLFTSQNQQLMRIRCVQHRHRT